MGPKTVVNVFCGHSMVRLTRTIVVGLITLSSVLVTSLGTQAEKASAAKVGTEVSGLSTSVTSISAGDQHTCALDNGSVKCWGSNEYGQLGDASFVSSSVPVFVDIGDGATASAISAGAFHTCALLSSGAVKCWGSNESGQLGDGSFVSSSVPVSVVIGDGATASAISAGGSHTCALLSTGGVKCWGYNGFGQLGNRTETDSNTPVQVYGMTSGATSISAGANHSCAVLSTGMVKCWGFNYAGQLGNLKFVNSNQPVIVDWMWQAISISAGGADTCAILSTGAANCWGSNVYGQLGDGTLTNRNTAKDSQVFGLTSGVTSIAAGDNHSCAVQNSSVKCWGYNIYGELGDGTLTNSSTPVQVSGLESGVTSIAAGMNHTCALLSTGAVKCWGSNSQWQLGYVSARTIVFPSMQAEYSFEYYMAFSVPYYVDETGLRLEGEPTLTSTDESVCQVLYFDSLEFQLQIVSVGTCTVVASDPGSDRYTSGSQVTHSFLVTRATQTISFNPGNRAMTPSFHLIDLTTVSKLPVTVESSTPSVCTVDELDHTGTTRTRYNLRTLEVGQCTLTASQAGNDNFFPATTSTRTFSITKAIQTITFVTITNKVFRLNPYTVTATSDSSLTVTLTSSTTEVCTVSGFEVTTVAVGTCTLNANQSGNEFYAAATQASRTFIVNKAAPGQPTDVSAVAGNASAQVLWTAPESNGGSAITSYTVTSTPGSKTCTTSTLTCTVTTLTNGVSYTFTVKATNGAFGFSSEHSGSVVPADVPGAPTITSVVGGDASLTVSFTPPSSNGGSTITNYEYSTDGGTLWKALNPVSVASPFTFSEASDSSSTLVNGATYSVKIRARNSVGVGPHSVAVTGTPATRPNAPMGVLAVAGNSEATVSWNAPVSNGGTAITGYTVTALEDSSKSCTTSETSCVVSGLTNGVSYRFTVTAANSVGDSEGTTSSDAVTPTASSQLITFIQPDDQSDPVSPFTVTATSDSSLIVSLSSSTPGVCTVSGFSVTMVAAGTCTLVARQPGDDYYAAAPEVSRSFTISRKSLQEITFWGPPDKTFSASPFTVTATSDSSLIVTLTSSTPGVCTVSGFSVTMVAAGTCTLVARQSGDDYYAAATQVSQSFSIVKVAQAITFWELSDKTYAASSFTVTATSDSSLIVTLTSSTLSVCTVSGFSVTMLAGGTCTLTASQSGDDYYAAAGEITQSFSIDRLAQAITFAQPNNRPYSASPFTVTATSDSGLIVTLTSSTTEVCTVSGFEVTMVAAGTCTLIASQNGNDYYAAATQVSPSFSIVKLTQTISFEVDNQTYSASPFTEVATSDSSLPVTVTSWTLSVCTVSGFTITMLKAGTCELRANQSGTTQYAAAPQVKLTFAIYKLTQTISFEVGNQTYSASPFTVIATSGSGLTVTLTSIATGVCMVSGFSVTMLKAGTCMLKATRPGDDYYSAAGDVIRSFTITRASQTISFAQPDDQTFSASPFTVIATSGSGLIVSLSSSTPEVCMVSGFSVTMLKTGTCMLLANQTGGTQYVAAPEVSRSFTIGKASQVITFARPDDRTYSMLTFTVTATSDSGLIVVLNSATPEVCTVSDFLVSMQTVGTCTLVANEFGDVNYVAANELIRSFTIGTASQVITFAQPDDQAFSESLATVAAPYSDSGLIVVLTSSTPGVCTVSGFEVSMVAVGTCTLRASQIGDSRYFQALFVAQSFTIKYQQNFNGDPLIDRTFSTTPFTVNVWLDSSLTVTLTSSTPGVCTVSNLSVTMVKAGICTLTASQLGNKIYFAANDVAQSFTITDVPTPVAAPTPTVALTPVAGSTPTVIPTPVAVAMARTYAVKTGRSSSLTSLAKAAGFTVPKGAKVSGSVSRASKAVCKVLGTKVVGSAPGKCTVTLKITPKKGKATKKSMSMNITGIPSLRRGASISVINAAAAAGLTTGSGISVKATVATSSKKKCKVSRSKIVAVKTGNCTVSVTVTSNSGATQTKKVTIKVK